MNSEWIASLGFEAARRLLSEQPSASYHGHSFYVTVRGAVPRSGDPVAYQERLHAALKTVCAPWQYADLNAFFSEPDDLTLAQAIRTAMQACVGTDVTVELRSAPERGVRCDATGAFYWLHTGFSAAHFLPNVPQGHQCGRLHGHGFKVRLWADAHQCSASALRAAWLPFHAQLHHAYLNHIEGLANPTSERLCDWLWQGLGSVLALQAVEVFETATAGSRRDASGFTIWKELRFESACPLDDQGRYTGHSYLARLFLRGGTLDEQAGWLHDFADVKAWFKPIYNQLDHFALDTLAGLSAHDTLSVAHWIAQQLREKLPEFSALELFEQEDLGAAVRWEVTDVHG